MHKGQYLSPEAHHLLYKAHYLLLEAHRIYCSAYWPIVWYKQSWAYATTVASIDTVLDEVIVACPSTATVHIMSILHFDSEGQNFSYFCVVVNRNVKIFRKLSSIYK